MLRRITAMPMCGPFPCMPIDSFHFVQAWYSDSFHFVQAWYREGAAAKQLLQWEVAAQAFFEAYRLDSTNDALATAFQEAIQKAREAYAAGLLGEEL